MALITGIPAEVSANGKRLKVAEINFLCVHKKLRRKNFAPVLIREVTRRINFERRVAGGGVHGWGGFTKTVRESKVLAPIDKREEVGGYKVHAVRERDEHGGND